MPPETLPDPEDPVAVPPKRSGRDRPKVLDIGAGDIEAPANAIPNIIADLVETETWRNAATILMGVLLIGCLLYTSPSPRD